MSRFGWICIGKLERTGCGYTWYTISWIHYSFAQRQRQGLAGACKWRFAGANDPRRPASSASAVFCANDGRSVLRPPLHPPGVAGSLETQVAVVVVRGGGGARHARSASGPATTGRGEGGSVGWACGRPAAGLDHASGPRRPPGPILRQRTRPQECAHGRMRASRLPARELACRLGSSIVKIAFSHMRTHTPSVKSPLLRNK